jgi:hypothetical protein
MVMVFPVAVPIWRLKDSAVAASISASQSRVPCAVASGSIVISGRKSTIS